MYKFKKSLYPIYYHFPRGIKGLHTLQKIQTKN